MGSGEVIIDGIEDTDEDLNLSGTRGSRRRLRRCGTLPRRGPWAILFFAIWLILFCYEIIGEIVGEKNR